VATGDVNDIVYRLRANAPPWFPNQGSAPVVDGILTGIATLLSYVYQLIQYARAQSRIRTSSGGWIDLIAWDFLGSRFTRLPGESDTAFLGRLLPELVRRRVTRTAIQQALVQLTGYPVRIIEPAQLTDVGFWKTRGSAPAPVSFYRVDTAPNPARWSSRGLRCMFFIECVLPLTASFGNNPMPAWGQYTGTFFLRGTSGARSGPSAQISRGDFSSTGGSEAVYSLISAMRAAGITCWVKFVPVPTAVLWDQPGVTWDQPGVAWDR
jgi:hypothetical protein